MKINRSIAFKLTITSIALVSVLLGCAQDNSKPRAQSTPAATTTSPEETIASTTSETQNDTPTEPESVVLKFDSDSESGPGEIYSETTTTAGTASFTGVADAAAANGGNYRQTTGKTEVARWKIAQGLQDGKYYNLFANWVGKAGNSTAVAYVVKPSSDTSKNRVLVFDQSIEEPSLGAYLGAVKKLPGMDIYVEMSRVDKTNDSKPMNADLITAIMIPEPFASDTCSLTVQQRKIDLSTKEKVNIHFEVTGKTSPVHLSFHKKTEAYTYNYPFPVSGKAVASKIHDFAGFYPRAATFRLPIIPSQSIVAQRIDNSGNLVHCSGSPFVRPALSSSTNAPQIIYLNFDGGTFTTTGNDREADNSELYSDARSNLSYLIYTAENEPKTKTVPAFDPSSYGIDKNTFANTVATKLSSLLSAYNIQVVTTRPAAPANYSMLVVGGLFRDIGIHPQYLAEESRTLLYTTNDFKNTDWNNISFAFSQFPKFISNTYTVTQRQSSLAKAIMHGALRNIGIAPIASSDCQAIMSNEMFCPTPTAISGLTINGSTTSLSKLFPK